MPIDLEDGSIHVYDGLPKLIRRNTNTLVIELEDDEIVTLIADLATKAHSGRSTYLVIEKDNIYVKDVG